MTLQKLLSTDTEGVTYMSTNKSSDEYAHDIDIWWGEADSRTVVRTSTPVTVMKRCRVVLVVAIFK